MTEKEYMYRALTLSLKGKGKTSPNPMVGSVIVRGKKIIAEGYHKHLGADHAEVMALKKAGNKANGATLYVTLEPCKHQGRTPPCTEAIIKSGIKNVVIGLTDPNPLMRGKSIAQLRRAGLKVKVGVLSKEIAAVNEGFVKYMTKRMPFVVAKVAQTLDGKIATENGHSKWITSSETRKFSRGLRNDFDAICVGVNTIIHDDPRLTASDKKIVKVIVDSTLRVPINAKALKKPAIVATTAKASARKIKALEKKGVEVIICRQRDHGRVDMRVVCRELAKRELAHVLIEGGSQIIGSALREKLVDKMHVYIAPKVLGDNTAINAVQGLRRTDMSEAIKLRHVIVHPLTKDIMVTGYVHGNN